MAITNPDVRKSSIMDLATAKIDYDAQKLVARFRLNLNVINNIRSQLTKLAEDMQGSRCGHVSHSRMRTMPFLTL